MFFVLLVFASVVVLLCCIFALCFIVCQYDIHLCLYPSLQPFSSVGCSLLLSLVSLFFRSLLVTYVFPQLLPRSLLYLAAKIPSHCSLSTLTLVLLVYQSFSFRKPYSLTRRCSVTLPSTAEDSLLLPLV